MTKEQALAQKFSWYEKPQKSPQIQQTYKIPDHIRDVPDSIINEILVCVDCGKNFRIIVQGLKYYKTKNIPIPRKCPDCRHHDRIKLRTPRQLFDRTCVKCFREIKSPYGPLAPEKVYCESCYIKVIR